MTANRLCGVSTRREDRRCVGDIRRPQFASKRSRRAQGAASGRVIVAVESSFGAWRAVGCCWLRGAGLPGAGHAWLASGARAGLRARA